VSFTALKAKNGLEQSYVNEFPLDFPQSRSRPGRKTTTEAKVSPILARLLALRGVTGGADASNFLSPSLDQTPFAVPAARHDRSSERLSAAITNRELI